MLKDVVYKCESVSDVINAEKIAEKCGWSWEKLNRKNFKYDDIESCKWLIYSIDLETNIKSNYWKGDDRNKAQILMWLSSASDGNPLFPNDLIELKKMLGGDKLIYINYNEPRKLVYEKNDIKVVKFSDFTDFDNIEYRKGSSEYGGILTKLLEFLRIYKTTDSDTLEFKIKDFETKSKMTIDEIKKLIKSKEDGQKLYDFNIVIDNNKLIISNLNKIGKNRPFESNIF